MQAALSYYGLSAQEYMAFGDSAKDISMLHMAGIGVAMEAADAETKAAAEEVGAFGSLITHILPFFQSPSYGAGTCFFLCCSFLRTSAVLLR